VPRGDQQRRLVRLSPLAAPLLTAEPPFLFTTRELRHPLWRHCLRAVQLRETPAAWLGREDMACGYGDRHGEAKQPEGPGAEPLHHLTAANGEMVNAAPQHIAKAPW